MNNENISFKYGAENLMVFTTRFMNNGALCVLLMCENGEPFAKLAVNVDGIDIPRDSFVLSHDIQDDLEMAIVETGKFTKIGTCRYGFCERPIYKFNR